MTQTHKGFTINQNEYGSFNVPTINCFSAQSVDSAKHAIDAYIERTGPATNTSAVYFLESIADGCAFPADDIAYWILMSAASRIKGYTAGFSTVAEYASVENQNDFIDAALQGI